MVINEKILGMCRTAIRHRLGSLDDLPEELANTIVNIFYKAFRLSMEWANSNRNEKGTKSSGSGFSSGRSGVKGDEFFESIANVRLYYNKISKERKLIGEMSETFQKLDKIVELVYELRKLNKKKEPRAYKDKVDFILDIMKYGIEGAEKKSISERVIERNLRKNKVDEIAGLYENL